MPFGLFLLQDIWNTKTIRKRPDLLHFLLFQLAYNRGQPNSLFCCYLHNFNLWSSNFSASVIISISINVLIIFLVYEMSENSEKDLKRNPVIHQHTNIILYLQEKWKSFKWTLKLGWIVFLLKNAITGNIYKCITLKVIQLRYFLRLCWFAGDTIFQS